MLHSINRWSANRINDDRAREIKARHDINARGVRVSGDDGDDGEVHRGRGANSSEPNIAGKPYNKWTHSALANTSRLALSG